MSRQALFKEFGLCVSVITHDVKDENEKGQNKNVCVCVCVCVCDQCFIPGLQNIHPVA